MNKPSKLGWNPQMGAAANARRHLPPLVTEYFAHVRQVLAANPPPPELHAIRLASKKLRYTLELFRDCYGPGLKIRLAALQELQQILGDVNDCVAAERVIGGLTPTSPSRLRGEHFLRRRAGQKAEELRQHWHEVFDAPGREQWWLAYLAKHAVTKKKSR